MMRGRAVTSAFTEIHVYECPHTRTQRLRKDAFTKMSILAHFGERFRKYPRPFSWLT